MCTAVPMTAVLAKKPGQHEQAIRARSGEGCRRREEARQQAKGSMPNMLNVWQWQQLAH